ncbi:MAG: hypothetical protein ABIH00_05345 [Armatimonadota bacterium]
MILLGFIPFIFGYYFSKVILKEKEAPLVFALSVSTGLIFFMTGVNLFSKFLSFKPAVFLTAFIMFLLSIIFYFYSNKKKRSGDEEDQLNFPEFKLNKTESLANNIMVATIIAYTLIFLFLVIDDDYFIHFPLVSLIAKGNSLTNPLFPDLVMKGHYGRNLIVSGFKILANLHPFMTLYILIPLFQVSTYFLILFTSARLLKNTTEALFVTAFAFFAINSGFSDAIIRAGLFELIHNNNPFVYNFLFLSAYFFFRAVFEKSRLLNILSAVVLAGLALVYETHYIIISLTILLFPFLAFLSEKKINKEYFKKVFVIFILSVIICLFQGGPLTDMARSKFVKAPARAEQVDGSKELYQGVHQEIKVSFPKKPFGMITNYAGKDISLFGKEFLCDQNFSTYLFPMCMLFLIFTGNIYGMFWGFFGLFAIFFPVAFDFGLFNSESLRFICAAGLGFAITLGICCGKVLNFIRFKMRNEVLKIAAVILFLIFLGFNFASSADKIVYILGRAVLMPQDFQVNINEKIISYSKNKNFTGLDIKVSEKLNKLVKKGDRFISNIPAENNSESTISMANLIITSITGCANTGSGLKLSKDNWRMMDVTVATGFRGRAFWNTLDPEILEDMKVKWIYLFRNNIDDDLYNKLKSNDSYKLVYSFEDNGDLRQIYEVIHKDKDSDVKHIDKEKLNNLKVTELYLSYDIQPESFYKGRISISGISSLSEKELKNTKIFYKIYDLKNNAYVNYMDNIKQSLSSGLKNLYFTTPYYKGSYKVKFYLLTDSGEVVKLQENKDFIIKI